DRAARLPEEGVFRGIAELELRAHFGGEIVVVVFVLDHAVRKAIAIEKNRVEPERSGILAVHGVFADEHPILRRAVLNESVPRFADGTLVARADVGELREGEIIISN